MGVKEEVREIINKISEEEWKEKGIWKEVEKAFQIFHRGKGSVAEIARAIETAEEEFCLYLDRIEEAGMEVRREDFLLGRDYASELREIDEEKMTEGEIEEIVRKVEKEFWDAYGEDMATLEVQFDQWLKEHPEKLTEEFIAEIEEYGEAAPGDVMQESILRNYSGK